MDLSIIPINPDGFDPSLTNKPGPWIKIKPRLELQIEPGLLFSSPLLFDPLPT